MSRSSIRSSRPHRQTCCSHDNKAVCKLPRCGTRRAKEQNAPDSPLQQPGTPCPDAVACPESPSCNQPSKRRPVRPPGMRRDVDQLEPRSLNIMTVRKQILGGNRDLLAGHGVQTRRAEHSRGSKEPKPRIDTFLSTTESMIVSWRRRQAGRGLGARYRPDSGSLVH